MQDLAQAFTAHEHMRATDRVLSLKPIEGKATISSTGLIDRRLFTGENKLHAVQNNETTLWTFKYEKGQLPPILQNSSFTSFKSLLKFATDYFIRRNIEIKEIID